jgi:hypothetical protein
VCVCLCVCGFIVQSPRLACHVSSHSVSLAAGVLDLAAGFYHTCALLTNSSTVCWGMNSYAGQLGTGDTTNRRTPTAVTGLETGESRIDMARGRCHGGHTSLASSRCLFGWTLRAISERSCVGLVPRCPLGVGWAIEPMCEDSFIERMLNIILNRKHANASPALQARELVCSRIEPYVPAHVHGNAQAQR